MAAVAGESGGGSVNEKNEGFVCCGMVWRTGGVVCDLCLKYFNSSSFDTPKKYHSLVKHDPPHVSIHNLRTIAPCYGELLALLVYLT